MYSTTTRIKSVFSIPEINSIKNKISIAYVHSLNSTINYVLQEPNSQIDGLGIDLIIINRSVGTSRKVASEANQINIQLKAVSVDSSSMLTEHDDYIQYNLKDNLYAIGTHYLVVVVLPALEHFDKWREVDDKSILLNAKAYYLLVDPMLSKGKTVIPKSNLLSPDSYKGLFSAASNKDAL